MNARLPAMAALTLLLIASQGRAQSFTSGQLQQQSIERTAVGPGRANELLGGQPPAGLTTPAFPCQSLR